MSRSRRKTPIAGITCSVSESSDKKLAAQRERKWLHNRLSPQASSDPDFDLPLQHAHPKSGGWAFAKDGKHYWGNSKWVDLAKLMRK